MIIDKAQPTVLAIGEITVATSVCRQSSNMQHRICPHAEQGFAMAAQSPLVDPQIQSTGVRRSL